MNPRYAQMLKTLKVAYFQQIPRYEQQMIPQIKQELKLTSAKINEMNKKQAELIAQLDPIQNNTQLSNLPENLAKKDQLNFVKTILAINIDSYYRIKRFLMVYHNARLNKIEEHYWHYSGNLKEQDKANLSQIEKNYFTQYKTIATEYMEAVGLELTTDIDPPVDASVEVLFLKDCGEILSDDGEPIKLEKNAAMYIKRRLVQNFIKDGSAQLMCSNSS